MPWVGFMKWWRAIRSWPDMCFLGRRTDRDPHVSAVESNLDHPVLQRCGDLRGEIGHRIHDCQPSGGLQCNAQYGCSAPGLLVTCRRRGGEVLTQLTKVRCQIHDVNYGVMCDASQGVTHDAVGFQRSELGL